MQSSQGVEIISYEPGHAKAWDAFVRRARNTHFFFERGFLEYHGDRFSDASFLVRSRNKFVAAFPANVVGSTVFSHQGLTYGGYLLDKEITGSLMISVLQTSMDHWRARGIRKVTCKVIPHIYHQELCEEDLYALHRLGARLIRRDLSSVLVPNEARRYSKGKKANLGKAAKRGLNYSRSTDYANFMTLVEAVLHNRHGTRPTHSASEIELLAGRFPENIRLYCVQDSARLLAGALVFINPTVVHTQYLACSDAGLEAGALDFLIDALITREFANWRYLSFGVSTEDEGRVLNEGLLHSKEAFGARGVVHDTYELTL